jgi:hypothetical protein
MNDTQQLAGCLTIVAIIVLAPFLVMAIPILAGIGVGLLAFFAIGAVISFVWTVITGR